MVVLAHGAGADHRHANMTGIAEAFAGVGLASLRFNFPYMQQGKRRVDRQAVSVEAIGLAHAQAVAASDLPLFLSGHSYGGRMASPRRGRAEARLCRAHPVFLSAASAEETVHG